jgi:hypothetical protein
LLTCTTGARDKNCKSEESDVELKTELLSNVLLHAKISLKHYDNPTKEARNGHIKHMKRGK